MLLVCVYICIYMEKSELILFLDFFKTYLVQIQISYFQWLSSKQENYYKTIAKQHFYVLVLWVEYTKTTSKD